MRMPGADAASSSMISFERVARCRAVNRRLPPSVVLKFVLSLALLLPGTMSGGICQSRQANSSGWADLPPAALAPDDSQSVPDTGTTGKLSTSAELARARQLIKRGQSATALPLLREYTRARPNDPDGHFWLGLVLDESGEAQQAIWAYSKSLDLANRDGMDSAELRLNIGNTLMKLNHPVDATFNYRRAIEIDSKLAAAHLNLGRALLEKGEAAEALNELTRSYELGLNATVLPYYKALAFRALGKPDDARSQLDLFLKTLPETPGFQEVRGKATQLLKELR